MGVGTSAHSTPLLRRSSQGRRSGGPATDGGLGSADFPEAQRGKGWGFRRRGGVACGRGPRGNEVFAGWPCTREPGFGEGGALLLFARPRRTLAMSPTGTGNGRTLESEARCPPVPRWAGMGTGVLVF